MTKVLSYNKMIIEVIQSTLNPCNVVNIACNITQKQDFKASIDMRKLIKYLFAANHTSLFEHCYITFMIKKIAGCIIYI